MEDAIPYFHQPDAFAMRYSAGAPKEIKDPMPWELEAQIAQTMAPSMVAPGSPELALAMLDAGLDADTMGSIFGKLKHAALSPFHAAANIVDTAISTPFNIATRVVQTPFNLANRAANAILPGGGGGGGGGGAAAAFQSMPPPEAMPTDAPPDGGGDPNMSAASGHWFHPFHHHPHHRHHAMMGFGMPQFMQHLNPFAKPAGKLLISAVPGGATALQARDIANKALKDGSLDPEHVKKASALTKAARAGSPHAISKIAKIKKAAGAGDPHAEVALDRMKLVDCIQSGRCSKPGTTSTIRHAYNSGLATLPRRRA